MGTAPRVIIIRRVLAIVKLLVIYTTACIIKHGYDYGNN